MTQLSRIAISLAAALALAAASAAHARPRASKTLCDQEAVVDAYGAPVFPDGATDIQLDEEDVDQDNGPLASLYSGDTSTDAFYPLPCPPSLGGTLPREATEPPTAAELEANAYIDRFDAAKGPRIVLRIQNNPARLPPIRHFKTGPCSIHGKTVDCNSSRFLADGQPFEGRDIIYVHGLATEHLKKWLANDPDAHKLWPQDASEFLSPTGYFRQYAEAYWQDHIRENLFDPVTPTSAIAGYQWPPAQANAAYVPKANRYLLVSWSSNQTLEYAQHALLTQIQLAMQNGTNVVTPPTYDQNYVRPFCANGCIIISHSTGGLIVSSAMSRAQAGVFGPGAASIPGHIRVHVALAGAISGSRLASIGFALGIGFSGLTATVSSVLCPVEDVLFQTSGTCSLNTSFVVHTILRDLIPLVAQGVWGSAVGSSPVPTLTVAGGHPNGNFNSLTKIFLPGLDDGVVSMNSACGNPLPVTPGILVPSGGLVTSYVQAFDMGVPLVRAVKNFLSQTNLMALPPAPHYLAAACTPWLSTTGMVMPMVGALAGTPWDTRKRYSNHFSFIQGSIDHSHMGGGDASNPWPSATGQAATAQRKYLDFLNTTNTEEMSAITDHGIYAMASDGTFLVHPSFANEMHEFVRGKKCCSFKLFRRRYVWWFWKRTYHLLNRYVDKDAVHFVYEYVARR